MLKQGETKRGLMEVESVWAAALESARDLVVGVAIADEDGQSLIFSALAPDTDLVILLGAALRDSTWGSFTCPTVVRDGRRLASELCFWGATRPTAAYSVRGLGRPRGDHRWRESSTLAPGEDVLVVGTDGEAFEASPARVTKILPPGTLDGDWDGGWIICDLGEAEVFTADVVFDVAGSILGFVVARIPGTGSRKVLPAEHIFIKSRLLSRPARPG